MMSFVKMYARSMVNPVALVRYVTAFVNERRFCMPAATGGKQVKVKLAGVPLGA